ncbi:MAG: FHA domain-containing protein [Gemmatimonadota bacterium]|nr:FHA domain-containing protein [Gemmatimonadota bacterium]
MPVIQVNNQQYSLKVGTTLVGAGDDADVPVPAHETLGVQAVVEVGPDRSASIRRASPSAVVRVNGVALGVEPTPLLHGDRVEVAGHELLFAEDHRGGATQYVQTIGPGATAPHHAARDGRTAATGGRLVSLVDGREYPIAATGVVIGRDAGCDVVVPHADVSRRHAEIVAAQAGYVLTDLSTNGVFVNGDRVKYSVLLGRGDVIRLGSEEFRFDADERAAQSSARSMRPVTGQSASAPGGGSRTMWALLVVVAVLGAVAFLVLG